MLIDGEPDRYIKIKVAAQDARQHGHGLFGPVFFVAGEEDDFGIFLREGRRSECGEGEK